VSTQRGSKKCDEIFVAAQVPEFNLKKPSAYNYDLALLGAITIGFGLIGLPPINGVLPQVRPPSLASVPSLLYVKKLPSAAETYLFVVRLAWYVGEPRTSVVMTLLSQSGLRSGGCAC